ncbi:MAG: YkgJ family cysteine cluster protein [Methanolinea sp.]|jgi:Fe-S-cluster containining protein|nr:YkgJ family cysteine cluster protein [Methanolinea sp.]
MAGISDQDSPGEEEHERQEESCSQCGLCCKVFGDRIYPTHENLYTWISSGRKEILRHFSACRADGKWTRCTELTPDEIGGIRAIEMRDPETGEYPPVCPFLRRVGKARYTCSIHAEKPDMCRSYMPWVFGETYFPRCRALEKKEGESQWSRIR